MELFSRIDIYVKSVILLYLSCVFCVCSDPIVSVTFAKLLRNEAKLMRKNARATKKLDKMWQNFRQFL